MKKIGSFFVLAALAYSACALTTEPLAGGGTALVVDAAAFASDEVTALNNNTVQELWKTGSSTLAATGIGSFTGVVRVKGGIYKPSADTGMGGSGCTFYVTQGGCLYTTYGAGRTVHIAGTGFGDYPALVKSSVGINVVMDDDATIGFESNWRSVGATLDMNGKTLTFVFTPGVSKSEGVWPKASAVSNPGHIILGTATSPGKMTFLSNSDQMQGSEHTLTVRNGTLDWYISDKKTNWKLIVEAGKSQVVGYNGGDGGLAAGKIFRWDGPVELAEGATLSLTPSAKNPVLVTGDISGAGRVSKSGAAMTSAAYLKGRNTYAGGTTVTQGTLILHSLDSMASLDSAKWSVSSDAGIALCMNGGDISDGFSESDVLDVFTAFKGWAANKPVRLAVADGAVANVTFSKASTAETFSTGTYTNGVFGLLGRVHFNSTFANKAPFTTYGNGVCEVSATSDTVQDVGGITVYGGTTILKNFGHVQNHTNHLIAVKAFSPGGERCARLVLDEGTYIDQGTEVDGKQTQVGYESTHGIIEIQEGAVITNNMNYVGSGSSTAYGAIYQSGGHANWGRNSSKVPDAYYGHNGGRAYIGISGGSMVARQHFHLASDERSTALIALSGNGSFLTTGGEFHIGWNGTGVVYQTGGFFNTSTSGSQWLRINCSHYTKYSKYGFGLFAVADSGFAKISNKGILMAERTNGLAHVALVDGGTLEAKTVRRATVRGAINGDNTDLSMPFPELCDGGKAFPSFVHFNGGILRAQAAGDILGARTATEDTRPTDVLVYSNGAVLDSSNFTVTVNAPLKAPTGKGVASIDLPTGSVRSGFLGAPMVSIEGDGEGATAVALFDKESGTISGFRITSAGRNYTTATARIHAGGNTSVTNLAVTLADNASGALVKRGTGTLVLNAVNTYGGRTVLERGVLKLGVDGALPSGTEIELAGGTVDANGHALPTAWHVDFSKVTAAGAPIAYQGNLAFPAGSTLNIDNVDNDYLASATSGFPLLDVSGTVTGTPTLEGVDNPLWCLMWRGSKLYMSSTRGTMLIFR